MIARRLEEKWIGASIKRYALLIGAQIKSSKEECARSMEQRLSTSDAAVKDAQNMQSKEECVLSMEQRLSAKDAAVKDAQIKSSDEESVGDTGESALLATNLLLLDPNSTRLPLLVLIYRIPVLLMLMCQAQEVLLVFLERLSFVKKS